MTLFSQLLFFVTTFVVLEGAAIWDYENVGKWGDGFVDCSFSRQSPIDVILKDTERSGDLKPLKFVGYTKAEGKQFNLVNTGRSVQLNLQDDGKQDHYLLSSGGLQAKYKAAQLHFHWGSADQQGSEHLKDSRAFPIELHIVHYNTEYGSLAEAVDKPSGLAVLAVWCQLGNENSGIGKLVKHFDKVKYAEQEISIDPFNILELLPLNRIRFFRYNGSLTTPPCFQSVIWTLFNDEATLSREQMDQFRSLFFTKKGDPKQLRMVDNYRPLQDINHRKIISSFPAHGAPEKTLSMFAAAAVIIFVMYRFYSMTAPKKKTKET